MELKENYYELLGLMPKFNFDVSDLNYVKSLTSDQIFDITNKAYLQAKTAEEKRKIREIYDILSDPKSKKLYDSELEKQLSRNIYSDSSLYKKQKARMEASKFGKRIASSSVYVLNSGLGLLAKAGRKIKLIMTPPKLRVEDVTTSESDLITFYNKKLEAQINELLNNPNNNYNLKIAYLKYKNQVELIKQLIAKKENEKISKVESVIHSLELKALYTKLNRAQSFLDVTSKKLVQYNKSSKLTKIYKKITETELKIDKLKDKNYSKQAINRLELKMSKLLSSREKQVKRYKLYNNFKYKLQDGALNIYDMSSTFIKNAINPSTEGFIKMH